MQYPSPLHPTSLPLPSTSTHLHTPLTIPFVVGTTTTTENGKEIKVVVKEVMQQTNACVACKARKRKCGGRAPCSFISSFPFLPFLFIPFSLLPSPFSLLP